MRLNYTTCQITQGSAPCSADAKFHDFFPLCETLQTDFEISPENHTMPECHANLFLTETPCRLLEKATRARVMFNWQTKILWIWEHTSQCWQRGNSAWISSDHTITHPWQTRHMLHFFSGHINFGFNLFIRVGIKKLSTELGWGLRKDYTAVSYGDTCLGCTCVGGVDQEYSWPNYTFKLSLCTKTGALKGPVCMI